MNNILQDKQMLLWCAIVIPIWWGLQYGVLYLVDRLIKKHWPKVDDHKAFRLLSFPSFAILCLVGWQAILTNFNIYQNQEGLVHLFERFYIVAIVWFLTRFVSLIRALAAAKFNTGVADNLQARKLQTQFQFLGKSANIVLIFIGLSLILMTFESVRRIGGSLIASAGLAGIIVGFAAQKSLGTFLSGFQVAFTQPIRLDDVVVVEGEWGTIEEITLTYVVIKIWDQRRLIVPISYFTEKPFQNWTRSQSALLAYVFINFDYTLSVESLREEFKRILNESPLWDGRVSILQVTDCTEKTMQLRFLASARNSPDAFDLRCIVREKMVAYVQKINPSAFPIMRIEEPSLALKDFLRRGAERGIQETSLPHQSPQTPLPPQPQS